MLKLILSALVALLFMTSAATAHKVVMSIFASGNTLEGELGFSNGAMVIDQIILVFDDSGIQIGEIKTDSDGYFSFQPTKAVTHVFRADLGAGHVSEVVVTPDQLPEIVAAVDVAAPSSQAVVLHPQTSTVDQAALAKMIRDELRPLRREISAYKEKNDFQSILGGIGYIMGIFGFAMYVAARRKLKKGKS